MIRKSLFWGLTLVLVIALAGLMIRGRQREKRQAEKRAETVEQSQASPTKVLQPDDLQVANSSMQREGATAVLHKIQIRNHGTVPYSAIYLAIAYLDQADHAVLTKTRPLNGITILPGQDYSADNIRIEGVPASATSFRISILSADLLPQETAGQPSGS